MKAIIKDDGDGFDYEALVKNPGQERGLGLAGMQERAVLLDGLLNISSVPGKGTAVEVSIPFAFAERRAAQHIDELAIQ